MGISKRKSRPVRVGDRPFRFMVKQTTIDSHPDQFELWVTVQEDCENPGRVLQFNLPYGCSVTPEGIRSVVAQALSSGWDPQQRGGPYILPDYRYP